MATKKSASGVKKSGAGSAAVKTTTKITTVKAVEAEDSRRSATGTGSSWTSLLQAPTASAAAAEFIGTFLFGISVLAVSNQPLGLFFALVGIFMVIGGVSGAHINPAITVGAWATRRIGWIRAVSYIVAQFLGAMLALVIMDAFIKQAPEVTQEAAAYSGQAAPVLFKASELLKNKEWAVVFAELIGVAILGFAYASVLRTRIKDKVAGALTVGGAGFVAFIFAGTAAGYVSASAILNPAVSITVFALDFKNVWTLAAHIVAPVIGAVVGFFLYDLIRNAEQE